MPFVGKPEDVAGEEAILSDTLAVGWNGDILKPPECGDGNVIIP
jgi:hypothetical protein